MTVNMQVGTAQSIGHIDSTYKAIASIAVSTLMLHALRFTFVLNMVTQYTHSQAAHRWTSGSIVHKARTKQTSQEYSHSICCVKL